MTIVNSFFFFIHSQSRWYRCHGFLLKYSVFICSFHSCLNLQPCYISHYSVRHTNWSCYLLTFFVKFWFMNLGSCGGLLYIRWDVVQRNTGCLTLLFSDNLTQTIKVSKHDSVCLFLQPKAAVDVANLCWRHRNCCFFSQNLICYRIICSSNIYCLPWWLSRKHLNKSGFPQNK